MEVLTGEQVQSLIVGASSLPLVKVNRDEYLIKEFSNDYPDKINIILERGPKEAGIPIYIIVKKAKDAINYETTKATALSFAAGIPGGFAMLGTIPADLTQFMGHSLRIAQKISYLCGMPGFASDRDMTEEEANMMLIYLGIMFGEASAINALKQIADHLAGFALKQIPKVALTKTTIYPILKNLLRGIGVRLTKDATAKTVSKVIPVIGGVASGGLTLITLKSMSNRLLKQLVECRFNYKI